MNVLIVEDEMLAAERIHSLLTASNPQTNVIETLDTVSDTIAFLQNGTALDLLVMDVQLADGKSLEIFEKMDIDIPVIFTTAYDQYAIEAFKGNSIEYLLKPVQLNDMQRALKKLQRLQATKILPPQQIDILRTLIADRPVYKERFLIKSGNKTQFKPINDVKLIFAEGKNAFIITNSENRKYLIDHTLDELEQLLNPSQFFRINRKYIVNLDFIRELKGQVSTKLEVVLNEPCDQELVLSRDRAADFKKWIDR